MWHSEKPAVRIFLVALIVLLQKYASHKKLREAWTGLSILCACRLRAAFHPGDRILNGLQQVAGVITEHAGCLVM